MIDLRAIYNVAVLDRMQIQMDHQWFICPGAISLRLNGLHPRNTQLQRHCRAICQVDIPPYQIFLPVSPYVESDTVFNGSGGAWKCVHEAVMYARK